MKSHDFSLAFDYYSKSIEMDPLEPSTFSNRSLTLIKLKDFSKALLDANQALKLKPDYLKAYHRRAKVYFETNKYELAIRDF
jgi:tetratricopeptide (TPR) repeat protein